jgi:hypothetical protein
MMPEAYTIFGALSKKNATKFTNKKLGTMVEYLFGESK